MRYTVIYEHGSESWGAYVPDLPGCVAVGDTLEEVKALSSDAIPFHIEGLQLRGQPVPKPTNAGRLCGLYSRNELAHELGWYPIT